MYETILLPTGGDESTDAVLEHVRSIAETYDATVHVLSVADTSRDSLTRIGDDVVDALVGESEDAIDRAASALADDVDVVEAVERGEPHPTILDYAERHDVDLVVMATRGRSGLERYLLGSTTERVLRQSDVPVMTIDADGG